MAAEELHLDQEHLALLRLLAARRHTNPAQLLAELVEEAADREMPGRRQELANWDPDAFYRARGVGRPKPSPEAEQWARDLVDSLREEGDEAGSTRRAA
jgi:hypothetical protein